MYCVFPCPAAPHLRQTINQKGLDACDCLSECHPDLSLGPILGPSGSRPDSPSALFSRVSGLSKSIKIKHFRRGTHSNGKGHVLALADGKIIASDNCKPTLGEGKRNNNSTSARFWMEEDKRATTNVQHRLVQFFLLFFLLFCSH